jgi:hypothetical protein
MGGVTMFEGRNLRWLIVGMLVGFVSIAVGALAGRPTPVIGPPPSPARGGDAAESEAVAAGLRIECRNDGECVKTSEADWGDGRGTLRRRFLRVRVYNDGPRAADGCRVTLRGVTEVTPGGLLPTGYDGPGLLLWSGEGAADLQGRRIAPNGNPEVADLFYTVHHPGGDTIHLKDQGYGSFLRFGRWYEFEVVATAANMGAVGRRFRVRFGAA